MKKISAETQRILKTIEYYYSDGELHNRCPVCGINPTKLDKELERIREQEREKVYKELIEEFDMLKKEDRVEKQFILAIIKEELSKLNNK